MQILVKTYLTGLLGEKRKANKIVKALQAGSAIIYGEYLKETPVDRGELRRKTNTFMTEDGFKVYTTANYAKYVAEGTGKYKNRPDAGFHTGRVRASRWYGDGSRAKFQARGNKLDFFKMLAKKGKIKGQKPNWFAYRAKEKSEGRYIKFITKEISKLL